MICLQFFAMITSIIAFRLVRNVTAQGLDKK